MSTAPPPPRPDLPVEALPETPAAPADPAERYRDLMARADPLTNSEPLAACELAVQALAVARGQGRALDEAHALLMCSRCKLSLSAYTEVTETARAALRIFDELNDTAGQARATMMLANVQVHLCDFPEGAYLYDRALELAVAAGDAPLVTMIRGNLTMVEADMGNWPRALEIAAVNRESNTGNADPQFQAGLARCEANAHLNAGLILLEQDETREAAEHLNAAIGLAAEALAIYLGTGVVRYQRSCQVIMAEAYSALGDDEAAVQSARAVLLANRHEMPRAAVVAQMVLGRVAQRAGRSAEAAALLAEALDMSELEADGLSRVRICRLLSEVHEALGNAELALKYSRRAATMQQVVRDEAIRRRARMLEDERRREHTERESAQRARMLQEKEAQLNHANRLAAAGEMLSVITHEMSQPLTAIMSYTDAGLRWLDDDPPDLERLRDALLSARDATLRAGDAIDRLRKFMSGRPPEIMPVDLQAAVHDTLEIMHPGLRRERVRIATQFEAQLPKVRADETLLVQVLANLVRNALEAMADVDERDRCLEIAAGRAAPGQVAVKVSDNGCGIGGGLAERIFDPFFSTKRQGMGLGLAVSRSIAQSFGGSLSGAPGASRGAVFTLTLDAC